MSDPLTGSEAGSQPAEGREKVPLAPGRFSRMVRPARRAGKVVATAVVSAVVGVVVQLVFPVQGAVGGDSARYCWVYTAEQPGGDRAVVHCR
ncbi:hypothetical protein GA0115260_1022810 [Streptomyces sp. MnatMP-M27]|nr:hypothetical protein GA0115260_1022810 [Streptomyces sp. MnatMP-M27]